MMPSSPAQPSCVSTWPQVPVSYVSYQMAGVSLYVHVCVSSVHTCLPIFLFTPIVPSILHLILSVYFTADTSWSSFYVSAETCHNMRPQIQHLGERIILNKRHLENRKMQEGLPNLFFLPQNRDKNSPVKDALPAQKKGIVLQQELTAKRILYKRRH